MWHRWKSGRHAFAQFFNQLNCQNHRTAKSGQQSTDKKKKSRKYFTIKKALIRWIIRSSDAHNHVFWHEKSAEGWGKGLHLFFVFFYPPLCVHLLSMGLFIHSAHNCISLSVHNNVMTAIWSKPPEYRDFLVLFLSIFAAKRNAWNNFNAHFN